MKEYYIKMGVMKVIVAACTQAAHAIVDFTKSAEDQRRRDNPLLPQAANDFNSVDPRQHTVNGHHNIIGRQSQPQPLLAVDREIDLIAARFQAIHQLIGRLCVVLDHKYVTRIASHSLRTPDPCLKSLVIPSAVARKVTFKSEINAKLI